MRILYLGNKLSKHGYNLTNIETLGPLLAQEGYDLVYASEINNRILRLLDMVFKTIFYSSKNGFVIIDAYSTFGFIYLLITSQICRLLNIKYIPILHGGNLPARLIKNPKLCRSIFDNAYLNIAPSNYLLSTFYKFKFKNIRYVPNTIEVDNYSFKERKNIQPKLLWVRSFDKIYNPIMAVRVFVEIKKIYPNATLCMVGPDKDGFLQKTKALAIKQNVEVIFTGKLSKPDWTKLSQDYDIFINTTHFDNTPISIIEAMALGLPVVSTNVGGIPFLLENNNTALLVNDDNVEEMVNSIKMLIENNQISQKIIKNARDLTETFDWKTVKQQWIKILQ